MFFTPELARRAAQRHTLSMRLASALRTRVARGSFIALVAFFAAFFVARADELKLKDGSTVVGTIVGFEEHSFKVKTSYGFAEVQKDQVVSIVISPVAKKKELEKKPDPSADAAVATDPAPTKVTKPAPAKPATPPANNSAGSPSSMAPPAPNSPNSSANAANKSATNPAAPSPAVANSPAAPPAPEPMREEVNGNTYVNDTYDFRMYKPPDWELIEGARALLPGSITALGTADQTTYLLIGQQPVSKSVTNDMDATERRLQEIMENFQPLDEKHITISGLPAIERHFRGRVDQREWSGVVVCIPREARLYTIFGMTVADTDLVQIQENVIARAISSLEFTK
jgi:hypothetical protein